MSGKIIIIAIDEEGAPSTPTDARTKFVNQVGYIVRENIPISFKSWKKAKDMEPADVVPEQEEQLYWEPLMSHFTLPTGQGIEEKVKQFALKKMTIAFQTFKKNLKRDYIKKGTTPDFENKSRCRSKAEQDEKFRALEERLSATEERVARLTGQEISPISPASNVPSSVASTEQCQGAGSAEPIRGSASTEPAHGGSQSERYSVDDIKARVHVDRVLPGWEDLELEIKGGDGEKCSRARSPPPADIRAPNMDPQSPPPAARDQSVTSPVPPPPPPKQKKAPKAKDPPRREKLPSEMTRKELRQWVDEDTRRQFATKEPEKKEPIDPKAKKHFKYLAARNAVPKKPLSDYDRQMRKANQPKRKGSSIPQLGMQHRQSIPPLKVLSKSEETMIDFVYDTNLTKAQLRGEDGEDDIPIHPGAGRTTFELGKHLVWQHLIRYLPTRMHDLHCWYMKAFAQGQSFLSLRFIDEHYFRGEDEINIEFSKFWFLFNQDALDKSLISAWVLMEQQVCRRKGFQNIGFMDPYVIHEFSIQKYPKRTTRNIWTFLEKQKDCDFILFPYNNHFHWMLLVIELKKSMVIVLDPKRKKQEEFQDVIDLMNKAWARFITENKGPFKEKLHTRTSFPSTKFPRRSLIQIFSLSVSQMFVIYADLFSFSDGPMTPQEFDQSQMAECLIPTERIKAVQEQLCGFLKDDIVDPKGEFHNDGSFYKPHVGIQDEDKAWP
ncbi:hypothetical protein QOZ80_8BG0648980 [Eleusine coracana subsp. coracana]|nr:hypothetical protein QOZ80_8BG0648980 [Eleusine coracana subsp. coracana]